MNTRSSVHLKAKQIAVKILPLGQLDLITPRADDAVFERGGGVHVADALKGQKDEPLVQAPAFDGDRAAVDVNLRKRSKNLAGVAPRVELELAAHGRGY